MGFDYRYNLTRHWPGDPGHRALWIMLNPSTADDTTDDPTIRRCINFSKSWGCSSLEVVNLFAARATNPQELATNPLAAVGGQQADETIWSALSDTRAQVICAWGVVPRAVRHLHRDRQVLDMVHNADRIPFHLGLTKDGHPRHPLYLPKTTRPARF